MAATHKCRPRHLVRYFALGSPIVHAQPPWKWPHKPSRLDKLPSTMIRAGTPRRRRRAGSLRLRRTDEGAAWRYFPDRCGSGRWARLLTGARAERDGSGKEDGCLPEPRIFSSGYEPPTGHTILWVAIASGVLAAPDELRHGDLAAFEPSGKAVEFEALTDTEFVLGSAAPHEHDLVLGHYSVHTSPEALRDVERTFRRSGRASFRKAVCKHTPRPGLGTQQRARCQCPELAPLRRGSRRQVGPLI